MASFSSSSANNFSQRKYDVFVSFKGEDTRESFISDLYTALLQKQIKIFTDYQQFRGNEMSQTVQKAIEASNILVVIFSKGYASSVWCLDELVKILEHKNKNGQIVIPVFYRVYPSDVKNQTGIFGNSFSTLEEKREDKLQRWRNALKEAANLLADFDSHVLRPDVVLIEKIVEDILKKLNKEFPSEDLNKNLVGVESHIQEIESLLSYGTINNTLGIWGIGGIGKTTIAWAIFRKISTHFDGSYFIENVREELGKNGDLAQLRRKLFSILKEGNNKKILVIFDDVTHFKQIEFLIRIIDWFLESLIIITTRNAQVLQDCGVKNIYEVKELVDVDALKLFSRYAFDQNYPDIGYENLSNNVIQYTQRNPLVLKVLGRFLSGKSKEEWESTINKLKIIPHIDIQKVLKISYDNLNDEEKNIFLKIACFLEGEDKDFVIRSLDAGFFPEIRINALVDKCLLEISNKKLTVHNLVREMGQEESINAPGRRRRLWHDGNIYEVSTYNKVVIENIYVITNFILEISSAVFDQLSSVHKPQYALVSVALSFAALLLCILELVYRGRKEKVTLKWRSRLPWFYYESQCHKTFGNLMDIIGAISAVCQCILTTISYNFVRKQVDNPIKISAWPIIFASGLLCSKFLEKPDREEE